MPQPNPITSLDAARTLLFNIGCQWRGASEFCRWAGVDMLSVKVKGSVNENDSAEKPLVIFSSPERG